MKAVIIEDEKLSAEHLANLLSRVDADLSIIANFDSIKKTVAEFKKGLTADLLFVDIHLADGLSFDIFSQFPIDIPVIFTTAYDEYAIQAFKLNSVDYLLKPIGLEDLRKAVEKFRKWNAAGQAVLLENIAGAYLAINKQYKNRFLVKVGDSISSIKTDEVAHFVSEEGCVLLVTQTGRRYVIDYVLDQLESMLPPDSFFRINRKAIVNISCIEKVSSYFNSRLKIKSPALSDDDGIVSRERVNDFKAWLDK
ncbi:MAG: LytTR family DNA-binding domain-containing protein [bacterium]|nr:LytTR family DNA-binding domain-containing protein [bacterium]